MQTIKIVQFSSRITGSKNILKNPVESKNNDVENEHEDNDVMSVDVDGKIYYYIILFSDDKTIAKHIIQ